MKFISALIGLFVAGVSIAAAVYYGLVVLLAGGVIEAVTSITDHHPADVGGVVWGIIKAFMLAGPVAGAILFLGVGLGGAFVSYAAEGKFQSAVRGIGRTETRLR